MNTLAAVLSEDFFFIESASSCAHALCALDALDVTSIQRYEQLTRMRVVQVSSTYVYNTCALTSARLGHVQNVCSYV